MSNRSSAGDRLRDLRERLGISQTTLAELTGILPNSISNYEQGRAYPSYEGIRKICRALKCSADELLGLPAVDLTSDESRMLSGYRSIDDDGRRTMDAVLKTQLQRIGKL